MNNTKSSFGTLLRRYRLAAGFTQEALAAQAGISARTIADLERGINRVPRHDTFELLMSALELTKQQRALFLGLVRPEMTAITTAHTFSSSRFPLPPTPLIGRQQELAHALSLLSKDRIRLLTFTGPAGIGKTRLALQISQDLDDHFKDGVVFVPIASLNKSAQLPGEIAQALGIRESPDDDISKQVIIFLKEKHVLLILDNFEQIVEAAPYVAELLSKSPRLSVLVTSRFSLARSICGRLDTRSSGSYLSVWRRDGFRRDHTHARCSGRCQPCAGRDYCGGSGALRNVRADSRIRSATTTRSRGGGV